MLAIAGTAAVPCFGGPPLSIDDPEILTPGELEIIVAGTLEDTDSGKRYLLPVLDLSYGLSENVQASAILTRAVNDPAQGSSKSDLGPGAIGVKWRFLARERLQMSVAPYYERHLRNGAVDRGVTDEIEAWVLPIELQYELTAWRFNAEVRYAAIEHAGNEWSYGVAAAYPVTERLELMGEVHGGADRELRDDQLAYRFGLDFAATPTFHLLASVGAGLDETEDDEDLDLQAYLGLQWFLDLRKGR